MYTLWWVIGFVIFLVAGVPVAASIGLAAIIVTTIAGFAPISSYGGLIADVFNSFILTAIPTFVLTGLVMSKGDISEKIWDFCDSLFGHLTGGLGYVNVVASMIFGGISGSSTADAGGLGLVEIDGMVKHGYPKPYASAITLASSPMAQNIPPSIIAVIFGFTARTNIIAQLFAGLVPGLVFALAISVVNYFYCRIMIKRGIYNENKSNFSLKRVVISFRKSFWALLAPVILLGGIIHGQFTPTEAGGAAAFYSIMVSLFVYKSIKVNQIPQLLINTGKITGAAMLVVAAASFLKVIFVRDGIQVVIYNLLSQLPSDTYIILGMLFAIILLGCVMDSLPAMLITIPIFLPIAMKIGVHPVHLGALMIAGFSVGLLTPPVGICLFIISNISKISIPRLALWTLPFYVVLVLAVIIIALVPEISLWVPRALGFI